MTTNAKPGLRPANPHFSSGPCAKRPGWTPDALKMAVVGRSHRAKEGKARLKLAIDKTAALLGLPQGYVCGIMPGSDTGAFEAAMWSMLGARGVDVLAWESFGSGWVTDTVKQLKLKDLRTFVGDYGVLPNLAEIDFTRDVVLTANGTASGVKVPNFDFVPADREGLTLVDATSAVFAQPIDWAKVDCLTFSWQKVMGGEAAHGMLILSPRAIERLENYTPPWPLPKVFRLTKGGKLIADIFEGATINTPSMLCVEDCLDALAWAEKAGGLKGLMVRCQANFATVERWVAASEWVAFLPEAPTTRSITSICLKVKDPWFTALPQAAQDALLKSLVKTLDEENVGKDIGSYRDAPGGIRIWGGATVEATDIAALLPWLDWAYASLKAQAA
ncbi:MAG: phosphoserine transaminase [Alphaproteobacteria bacterium]|nr:phosphoserine transaminase [Alphaproteobacteria bacterium]